MTDGVDQTPHCVLLLDEIEKAHPDLFNILLQIMDHGKLTDHNGKQVDFRNVILIMTTNAGASELAKAAIGFGHSTPARATTRRRSTGCSRRNSATASMRSSPSARCRRKSCTGWWRNSCCSWRRSSPTAASPSSSTTNATAWLAERGYDERMGARPLGRLIQEEIKKPLAEEVLFGKLQKGGIVKVTVEDNPEGGTRLKLESIPDENAQRKEKPLRPPRREAEKPEGGKPKPSPGTPKGGGSVPRVPLKA